MDGRRYYAHITELLHECVVHTWTSVSTLKSWLQQVTRSIIMQPYLTCTASAFLQPLTVCQRCLGRGLIAPAKKLHAALLTRGKGLCYFSGFLLKVKSQKRETNPSLHVGCLVLISTIPAHRGQSEHVPSTAHFAGNHSFTEINLQ